MVSTGALQGDRMQGWGQGSQGPGTEEDGGPWSSGLPRQDLRVLCAQGGILLLRKDVSRQPLPSKHCGSPKPAWHGATHSGALLLLCIIKLFLGRLG